MRFKNKKVRKQRASTYHGWGRGAAHHKGAGNRGGRGRAGSGKRADQKKPSYWDKETPGKRGFTSKSRLGMKAINLTDVCKNLALWTEKGFVVKAQAGHQVDLKKAGYDKLLGMGDIAEKLFIKTDFASKNAVAKVKEAGGEVTILKTIIKKEKKKADKPKKAVEAADEKEDKEEDS